MRIANEAATTSLPPEQHLMNLQTIPVDFKGVQKSGNKSVNVVVPPLHFQVVTARLNVPTDAASIAAAKQLLETTLSQLDRNYDPATPAGLGVTVAWGLPYFQTYLPALRQGSTYFPAGTAYPNYLPVDNRASKTAGETRPGRRQRHSVPKRLAASRFPRCSPAAPGGKSGRCVAAQRLAGQRDGGRQRHLRHRFRAGGQPVHGDEHPEGLRGGAASAAARACPSRWR